MKLSSRLRAPDKCYIMPLIWKRLKYSRLYALTLLGKSHIKIANGAREVWRGNSAVGQRILTGKFYLFGQWYSDADLLQALIKQHIIDEKIGPLSNGEGHKAHEIILYYYAQGFSYLLDWASLSGSLSRKSARKLIELWIRSNHSLGSRCWLSAAWQPGIIGLRLSVWFEVYDFYASTADDEFQNLLHTSIAKQLRFLKRHWREAVQPLHRLWAIKGLLLAYELKLVDIPLGELLLDLQQLNESHILPDGGHISRSPFIQWRYMRDLIDLRCTLHQILSDALNSSSLIQMETIEPEQLPKQSKLIWDTYNNVQTHIRNMTPVLRLMRHVDGSLAQFKGAITPDVLGVCATLNGDNVDNVLSVSDSQTTRPLLRLPATGLERLSNRSSVLLLNTYPTVPSPGLSISPEPSINLLNFEWSVGHHRLIESAEFIVLRHQQEWLTLSPKDAVKLTIKRHMNEGNHYIVGDLHFEEGDFWCNWQRHLSLSPKGDELRGVDMFQSSVDCVIGPRFHFNMASTLIQEGEKVMLTLIPQPILKRDIPLKSAHMHQDMIEFMQMNSPASKRARVAQEWLFRAQGGDEILTTTESDNMRQLLVVKQTVRAHTHVVKWSFARVVNGEEK